jgi:hypothetical protein
MADPGEIITETGIYTAPDGRLYSIEFRDVHLTCPDDGHEHDMRCYRPADGGPPLIADAISDQDWAEGNHDA